MSPAGFRTEQGATPIKLGAAWRLLTPPGTAPAGGWPLVVCLHGMGMGGEMLALLLNDLVEPGAAYLFPDGPYPYEIRKADKIRIGHAWYLYDGSPELFRSTLERTEAHLLRLIDETARRIGADPSRVYLLGYSQGAYAGYFVALRNPNRFAGLIAIAGRMKEEFVAEHLLEAAKRLAVLILHGEQDSAVRYDAAQSTHAALLRYGFDVELRSFPQGHLISREEVQAAREWLRARMARPG